MRNVRDIIGSGFLLLCGSGVVVEAFRLKLGTPTNPEAGAFPFIYACILIGLSLILLWQGVMGRDTVRPQAFGEFKRPAVLVASMSLYTYVLETWGYILPTIALSIVILRILGVTSWKVLSLFSLVLSIGTYVIFGRFLGIILPAGPLQFLG